ncbi:alkyldihydroxyacetonephosphate synthase [Fistulifera solaris]|uniref:alkylglycerone-phosphate synthase n=1 Tax=Fistulifera solaris TaxID=1519565 RepID=A0A1Z5JHW7_FISSO|nr:alkyldihydroxyacetonephosphate synthase [Fistulifera solaris]|eukprot:GAX13442.1 alkyldihydroxyacetonephosphate synthase [Fistulifera solaris]
MSVPGENVVESDKLASTFETVSRLVSESNETPNDDNNISTDTKLKLYGLFKRVRNGACEAEPPPVYRVKAHAKHKAWMECSNLSKIEAMQNYIDLVAQQTHNSVGQEAQRLVDHLRSGDRSTSPRVMDDRSIATSASSDRRSVQNKTVTETSQSHVGIIPRGHLDIAYSDLLFAATHCLFSSLNLGPNTSYYEQEIIDLWQQSVGKNVGVIPGFSARTLLDLYLRTKRFPSGSQIIICPPITVPGIEEVLRHHRLEVVPVDIPEHNGDRPFILVDMNAVEHAITDKTVAIIVVHVFGMLTASSEDMQRIHTVCRSRGVELIEDCAECFGGLPETENDTGTYLGSPYSDIVLFSFGFIKTATALGGGVAIVRDKETHESMKRLFSACYPDRQSYAVFFSKVCKALLIRLVTDHPVIYGLLVSFFRSVRLDFDTFATALTRGFKSSTEVRGDYMAQIRFMPCSSLLALLIRRMKQGKGTAELISARRRHCGRLADVLRHQADVRVPRFLDPSYFHACWLFPVLANNVQDLCVYLTNHGIDATQGASQLRCIGESEKCPRAYSVMKRIMYLPVSNGAHRISSHWINNLPQSISNFGAGVGMKTMKAKNVAFSFRSWVAFSFIFSIFYGFSTFLVKVCTILFSVMVCVIATAILATQFLRLKMASFYLESSNAFAKYSYLFDLGSKHPSTVTKNLDDLNFVDVVDETHSDFDTGDTERSVLLTGVTGFVGSTILRELLCRRRQYSIKRIYVIVRPKGGLSSDERIHRLLENPIFSCVPKDDLFSAIVVMPGDISQANAGLAAESLEQLKEEPFITHVYNCAATVSFTQSLQEAAESNISSALNVQRLAAELPYQEVNFVHISTAFVHGDQKGSIDSPLGNNLFDMKPYDPVDVYKSMCGTQYYATKAMNDLGFSNAYQLSKCVVEHLLQNISLNTIIIRPSIVGPAVCESLKGWAGSRPSTITAAPCLYFSYQWNIWSFGDHAVPCIPVDVLARFIANKTIRHRLSSSESEEDRSSSSDEDFEKVSIYAERSKPRYTIHVAAWDVSSNTKSQFTWLQFAVAITQTGVILGYFSRLTAYLGLWVATRVLPRNLTVSRFKQLHQLFVENPFSALLAFYTSCGYCMDQGRRFSRFLDLPVLFFPFMNSSFYFSSDLIAPPDFDGERYMMICLSSASRFLQRERVNSVMPKVADIQVAGNEQCSWIQAWLWAFMQPKGPIAVRVVGALLNRLLCSIFSSVIVDLGSFCDVLRDLKMNKNTRIILASTHRSFFDFLLLSYVCFALPELGIDLPFIISADSFERLPVFGIMAKLLGAVFVKRNRGRIDPSLEASLNELPASAVIEVFLEGTRSRDRRFVRPKTGVLRCLSTNSHKYCIIPITMSYEKIPEQPSLVEDIRNSSADDISTKGLLSWAFAAFSGEIRLGKAWLSACDAVTLPSAENNNIDDLVIEIQRRQASQVMVSSYHISALAHLLGLTPSVVKEALSELGCRLWLREEGYISSIPSDQDELWTVALQASAYLAPLFIESRPLWAQWLFFHVENTVDKTIFDKASVSAVTLALLHQFDEATECVKDALAQLKANGFPNPEACHVLQFILTKKRCPIVLVKAAISHELRDKFQKDDNASPLLTEFPKINNASLSSGERLGFWGFSDSFFVIKPHESGGAYVTMDGNKYSSAGKQLSDLVPFLQRETGLSIDLYNEAFQYVAAASRSPLSTLSSENKVFLEKISWKVSYEDNELIRHGTGHSLADIWDVRNGSVGRVPDAVVWPSSEGQVVELIRMAQSQNWCLIPFGGGTNVSQATKCPSIDVDPRPIISVDMTEMRKILAVDEENEVAHVECGITGRELVQEMKRFGYTIGHQPDSYEFSTLGGWIATKASGMKRTKYGNIEDIVISVRVAGPEGIMAHSSRGGDFPVWGREATGLELLGVVLGSEGCLGIITSAVIRIWPLSKVQDYDSVLLPSFDHGLSFVRDVQRLGSRCPASIRLLDNDHFRLGRALRANPDSVLQSLRQSAGELYLKWRQDFDSMSTVCTTILYEGSREEVDSQKQMLKKLISRHGGFNLGAAVGEQGYNFTFLIAYLRDFALTYNFLGDSFESFVPWSKIKTVVDSVKDRIRREHAQRCLPGSPFIGCRVTQLYHEGACLYFYFSMSSANVTNPSRVFLDIEHAAREEILRLGGSLSHHHGIGKTRSAFLGDIDSPQWIDAKQNLKRALDPDNIFGAQNCGFSAR